MYIKSISKQETVLDQTYRENPSAVVALIFNTPVGPQQPRPSFPEHLPQIREVPFSPLGSSSEPYFRQRARADLNYCVITRPSMQYPKAFRARWMHNAETNPAIVDARDEISTLPLSLANMSAQYLAPQGLADCVCSWVTNSKFCLLAFWATENGRGLSVRVRAVVAYISQCRRVRACLRVCLCPSK